MNEVHRPVAVSLVQQAQLILQQDNAWPYVARVSLSFLANHIIIPLDWPPHRPYWSSIEHRWDEQDRRVQSRWNIPTNLAQLRNALLQELNILLRSINALMNTMRMRIRTSISGEKSHTRYWLTQLIIICNNGSTFQCTPVTDECFGLNFGSLFSEYVALKSYENMRCLLKYHFDSA